MSDDGTHAEAPAWLDLDDDETLRWRGQRAGRIVLVALVLGAVGWLVGAAIVGIPAYVFGGQLLAYGAIAVVTIVVGLAVGSQVQSTRNAEYVATDRALYVSDGATFTQPRRVDRAMIRSVRAQETVFERVLGLGIVVVETETDDVWLFGLEDADGALERIRAALVDENQ